MYKYNAKCVNVVDGDTVDLLVDLGFNVFIRERFRLAGIDAYEPRRLKNQTETESKLGKEGKVFLRDKILDKTIQVTTTKVPGKYGRWIGELYYQDVSINKLIVNSGYAVFKSY
tara:strand:+ start:794 stop:1135 length:342 start_codon:yes stop_codon:yes gene_type:complete